MKHMGTNISPGFQHGMILDVQVVERAPEPAPSLSSSHNCADIQQVVDNFMDSIWPDRGPLSKTGEETA